MKPNSLLGAFLLARRDLRSGSSARFVEHRLRELSARALVQPRSREEYRIPESDREDVVQDVYLAIMAKLGGPKDILEQAVGAGRRRARRNGGADFEALGVLDLDNVFADPASHTPELSQAIVEAESALDRYLSTALVNRWLDVARGAKRRAHRTDPVEEASPESDRPDEQLHRARLNERFSVVQAVVDAALQRVVQGKRVTEQRRKETEARYRDLRRVGLEEASIESMVMRELEQNTPSLGEPVEAAIQSLASGAHAASPELEAILREARAWNRQPLADALAHADEPLRTAAMPILRALERLRDDDGWDRARARVDTRNRRLRNEIIEAIGELNALPPSDPSRISAELADHARAYVDLLLRKCQKPQPRTSSDRARPSGPRDHTNA